MLNNYKELWKRDFLSWFKDSDKMSPEESWIELLEPYNSIFIYGAGNLGRLLGIYLSRIGIKVTGYIDRNKEKIGKELFAGIKCVAINDVPFDSIILVTAESGNEEIINTCKKISKRVVNASNVVPRKANYLGDFLKKSESDQKEIGQRIAEIIDYLADEESKRVYYLVSKGILLSKPYHNLYEQTYCGRNEYFREDIFLNKYERYVDCGAYTGDTFCEYLNFMNGNFREAYLFEMEKDSCQILTERCKELTSGKMGNVSIYNKGVSDKKEDLYTKNVGFGSLVSCDGKDVSSFNSLDNLLKDKRIDFVKMDIEGNELEALHGGAEILRTNRPDMAICIYHKVEDLWEIPEYIMELMPGSKLYIRHCSHYDQDIILYVVNQ